MIFFQNFLKLFLVGLHEFAQDPWFAPDTFPMIISIIYMLITFGSHIHISAVTNMLIIFFWIKLPLKLAKFLTHMCNWNLSSVVLVYKFLLTYTCNVLNRIQASKCECQVICGTACISHALVRNQSRCLKDGLLPRIQKPMEQDVSPTILQSTRHLYSAAASSSRFSSAQLSRAEPSKTSSR